MDLWCQKRHLLHCNRKRDTPSTVTWKETQCGFPCSQVGTFWKWCRRGGVWRLSLQNEGQQTDQGVWRSWITVTFAICGGSDRESACTAGDPVSVPGLGRSAEKGMNPPRTLLWHSTDIDALQATVRAAVALDMAEWLILTQGPAALEEVQWGRWRIGSVRAAFCRHVSQKD